MRRYAILLSVLGVGAAQAESFNYEITGNFSRTESSVSEGLFFAPPPMDPDLVNARVTTSTEQDDFQGAFTWYFGGLSDDNGPRREAVFTDRASFLQFGIQGGSAETSISDNVGIFDSERVDVDTDGLSLSGRYVLRDSGWFFAGNAGVLESTAFGATVDVEQLTISVGKYLGETTTLEFAAGRTEVDTNLGGNDVDSGLALRLKHLGQTVSGWFYGIDVALNSQSLGGSNGSYSTRFSLFPTRDVSLSLGVQGQLGAEDVDTTRFELRGGWFVNPNLELQLGYGVNQFDESDSRDFEEDGFFVGARYRF